MTGINEMKDLDLLVALDYLLTHHRDALTKWAWGKTRSEARTTYQKLERMQKRIESGGELTDSNRKYIQMVFSSKHGVGCKIEEWSDLEKYRKTHQSRQKTKQTILSVLKGKKIPVRFKHIDKYGNAIGWVSLKSVDGNQPAEIEKKIFLMPKDVMPANFKIGLIYDVICLGITSSGAIKVKLA
ncbi:MAG: hypothetical protein COV69_00540 [Parcubacteria group bacterium CG11_big_fil_rev_8_21_14_0_20_39_14]|nr:MAG: hypothetical protein COV69_00540 [Parcubacteria group bacterium CG11_big_fil_rev_8_21_14_0_20_39_14]PIS35886.1 MAG: hypothetical protein COT36_00040 [Parcubacteria group bacterium CG08_land_8_20_14_0_20_38_56]